MSASYSNTNKFALLFAPAKGASAKQPPPKALDEKIAEVKKINETEKKATVDRRKTDNKPTRGRDGQRGGRGVARNTEGRAPRSSEDRKPRREPREGGEGRQKRQYDRRSGTGRNPTEQKKGNYGKGNWGTEKDAVAGDKEGVVENVEGTTEETPVAEEVPEVKTFTLAEFEKQQQENQVKVDRPAPRVVEVDADLLKKFTKLEKKGPSDKAPKKEQKETKDKANKKQFVPLNEILDVKAPQPQNDRFARGPKGKKPANRGNRSQFTYDEGAFPKLG